MTSTQAAATPAVLYVEHQVGEYLWSLAIVRTRWTTEGTSIVECTKGGPNPHHILAYAKTGDWSLKSTDDGPAVMSVDIDKRAIDPEALTFLVSALVDVGGSWGIEASEIA